MATRTANSERDGRILFREQACAVKNDGGALGGGCYWPRVFVERHVSEENAQPELN